MTSRITALDLEVLELAISLLHDEWKEEGATAWANLKTAVAVGEMEVPPQPFTTVCTCERAFHQSIPLFKDH